MATDDWATGESARDKSGTADKASASDLAAKHAAAVGQSARARQELTRWQAVSRQHPGPAGQQKQRSSSSRHSYRRARKHAARSSGVGSNYKRGFRTKKHYSPAETSISSEMQQLSVCANARMPAEQEATSKAAEATKEVGGDSPPTPLSDG